MRLCKTDTRLIAPASHYLSMTPHGRIGRRDGPPTFPKPPIPVASPVAPKRFPTAQNDDENSIVAV
jgi:hypothetical protein